MAAEAIVSFIVQRLGNLLVEEAKFLNGVGGQVQQIKDDLRWMQGFLKDACTRKIEAEGICNWVADVRELAYDAEDVLESYVLEMSSKRREGGIQNILRRYVCILNKCIPLHKVGSDIQDIKTKISELTTRVQAFNITSAKGEGSSSSSSSTLERQHQLRQTYAHVVEEDFVGLKGDVENLVAQLLNKYYQVVSIWGMGGLGKTTLAQRIYNHPKIKSHFEGGLAWVCVSQQWQTRDVLQRILSKLEPERKEQIMNLHMDVLVEQLYKVQQAKRCLVVLDDIWDQVTWRCLRSAFPIGKEGSKILVTTRNEEAAREVDPHGFIYKPRFLTEDESWVLLQKKALSKSDGHKVNNEMERKGKEMVKRCGGLPLAIIVLGGILANRHTLIEWEMVCESMDSYLRKGKSIGEEHGGIQYVLNLSYNELPHQLKPCFLYLGHFVEDYMISTEKLCLLWMAEGIISSNDRREGETMMDVAERYLGELAQRSMVQLKLTRNMFERKEFFKTIWSRTRRFEYCRLHDLMRELCILKGKEEDFVKVVDFVRHANKTSVGLSPTSQSVVPKQRRLAFYLDGDDLPKQLEISRHVRSLLFLNRNQMSFWEIDTPTQLLPKEVSCLLEFKFLRVLDFDDVLFREGKLPQGIENLIHLRHLNLKKCRLEELPSSMGNLQYLETLYLPTMAPNMSVPNILWKMKRLRHLYLPFPHRDVLENRRTEKLRLDGLHELEILQNFDNRVYDVNDLYKLTNLRNLMATIKENLEDLEAIINYLNITSKCLRHSIIVIKFRDLFLEQEEGVTHLTKLFGCRGLDDLSIKGRIGKLPSDHRHFSPSLTTILLRYSQLKEDPMPMLEKFPNLRDLHLAYESYMGKQIVCSATGFPQLRFLAISVLPSLEEWRVDEGAMPNLSFLLIYDCYKLKMLPDGLRFITTLQKLKLSSTSPKFNDRVRVVDGKEGEDFYKVRHVPSITID